MVVSTTKRLLKAGLRIPVQWLVQILAFVVSDLKIFFQFSHLVPMFERPRVTPTCIWPLLCGHSERGGSVCVRVRRKKERKRRTERERERERSILSNVFLIVLCLNTLSKCPQRFCRHPFTKKSQKNLIFSSLCSSFLAPKERQLFVHLEKKEKNLFLIFSKVGGGGGLTWT